MSLGDTSFDAEDSLLLVCQVKLLHEFLMDFLKDSLDDDLDQSVFLRQRASVSLDSLSASFTSPSRRQLKYDGNPSKLLPPRSSSPQYGGMMKRTSSLLAGIQESDNPVERLQTLLNQSSYRQRQHGSLLNQQPHSNSFAHSSGIQRNVHEKPDFLPRPEDLIPILDGQSSYIQQLEGENRFLKEELSSLKKKIDAVVQENTRLNEELKTMVIQGLLTDEEKTLQKEKDDIPADDQTGQVPKPSKKPYFLQWIKEHEKLKSLYESRVNQLDAQLSYTRANLKKKEEKVQELEKALRMQNAQTLLDGRTFERGLCLKCAKDEAAVVSSPNSKSLSQKLIKVTRERDELVDSLTAVQTHTMDLEKRESEAFTQVQQSIQLVEEAQLERNKAIFQVEQLKDDLAKMEARVNDLIAENQEKLMKEREITRQECQGEVQQIEIKLHELENELVVTKNEADQLSMEKSLLKSELEDCKERLKQREDDLNKVNEDVRYTTATAKVQRDSAFRELERTRNNMEIELRSKTQENLRLSSELEEIRRRMESAEKGLNASQTERMTLTDQLNTLQRELSMIRVEKETNERTNAEKMKIVSHQADQKHQELKQTLHIMESQHTLTVAGLEAMISDQNSLIGKLRDQCRDLTSKLEKMSSEFSSEKRRLLQSNSELSSRSNRLYEQHGEMERQCIEHGKMHQKLKARLHQMDDHAKNNAKQVVDLLKMQNELLHDRDVLKKEVEFLRKQISNEGLFVKERNMEKIDVLRRESKFK